MILKTRWQRLAFVLSLLWILGAGLWERSRQIDFVRDESIHMSYICEKSNEKPRQECLKDGALMRAEFTPIWFNIAFIAIAPLFGTWILGAIALATFRWIRKGS